jgi:putative NADPH-quinone reductase
VMKNWFDRNFTSGFAFKNEKWGKLHKLLKGKRAKIFATAGGPGWVLKMMMYMPMVLGRFGYVGMKTTSFKVFWNFPKRTPEEKEQFLNSL